MQIIMDENDTLVGVNINIFAEMFGVEPATGLRVTFEGFEYRVTGFCGDIAEVTV